MKWLWMIIAGTCIAVAAFMALLGKFEAAFVIAAVGVVCWFLNYRRQMRDVVATADLEEANNGEVSDEN